LTNTPLEIIMSIQELNHPTGGMAAYPDAPGWVDVLQLFPQRDITIKE